MTQNTQPVVVYKGRTNIVQVHVGYDISGDDFASQIRAEKSRSSTLIASWGTSFLTDGTDGELLLTLDDSVVDDISESGGYMDLKRTSGGEPLNVWDDPLEVLFRESVTA